ncbi:MAG: hypothetical protein A3G33_00505 [Omnitrophica bacterium RIFCSPLOWO2_12_FULL_44_17]|uniref:DUF1573 domain-containing protein n=1 Tax=Candidatus Danuiimicrobium aquiferis TaxID=1801832 RepID=A0A1G1L1A1_9BACT|nr:MAG: hypothetical protein A3B72_04870 [Omnitrophica bacterium RIFCSPHIGHO2_02_FULL_45_28]OGW91356.1 MAG: hypothetical protein A3E74_09200 [Omnitrophica bacterium RIFCSPHIGHO2_12_FULL_44_12]OGW98908.1 MAG: hypothetical protein A3G33_00505 [Omnitrophica bacterium RIFCSPLOWO2_12_FULL_44_17]OGX03219.1 MAG: hypothetical protein A3J12_09155 [Omnitrophica bacterium RIFCSPLOWO2_02_FULL_44_11]
MKNKRLLLKTVFAGLSLCVFCGVFSWQVFAVKDVKPLPNEGAVPSIYIALPNYDFGKLPAGQIVNHEFMVENRGNADLEIKRISTSCGCTVAEAMPQVIKPNETGKITVKFDSRGKSGKQSKTITVYSNDSAHSSVGCLLTGELV